MFTKKLINLINRVDKLNNRVDNMEFIVYSSLIIFGGITVYKTFISNNNDSEESILNKYSKKKQTLLKKKNSTYDETSHNLLE